MKLLIIAGPYEADRIRRAAVSAGFEAVAVEPGESLSGWITASRPDVIILVPQIVHPDPVIALGKLRAVPRGRVPIFLVGDVEERDTLEPLADGFFVRPLAPDDLLARAREVHGAPSLGRRAAGEEPGSGPHAGMLGAGSTAEEGSGGIENRSRPTPLKPLVPGRDAGKQTLPKGPRGPMGTTAAAGSLRRPTMFDLLADNIEADFDAEIRDAVRAVDALRSPARRGPPSPAGTGEEAAAELRDERSQKTLEVPHDVTHAVADAATLGDEVDLELPSLLARMYLSRLSGRLTLKKGGVSKHIVFERGHPVLASSTRRDDRMGEMLVRQGRFTAAQIAACGTEAASSGRRMGAVLVDRGLIKPSELSQLVRRHYEDIIYSLFSWDRGLWNLGADKSASAEKILLSQHPAALILEGIRRKYSATRALAGLGGSERVLRLRLTSGASDLLEKMGISSDERNLVLLFDGVRSLGEIRALTNASAERLYGVAWALFVLERLEATDASASESSFGGDRVSARARDEAIDRALVMSRHALVEEGDYFQILGVGRDASAQEIRRAHEVLTAELSPETLHPAVAGELAAELAEIRLVLAEAARLMTDDRLRRLYREALPPRDSASLAPRPSGGSPS